VSEMRPATKGLLLTAILFVVLHIIIIILNTILYMMPPHLKWALEPLLELPRRLWLNISLILFLFALFNEVSAWKTLRDIF